MFYVYILYSQQLNKYYIGYTSGSVTDRLKKHLHQHKGFTAAANDWCIVHVEEFTNKSVAMQREKQIKRWKSQKAIQQIIDSSDGLEHPDKSGGS